MEKPDLSSSSMEESRPDSEGKHKENKTFSTDLTNDSGSGCSNMTEQASPVQVVMDSGIVNMSDFQDKMKAGKLGGSAYFSASSDDDSSSDEDSGGYRRRSTGSSTDSASLAESLTGRQDTRIAARLRIFVVLLFLAMGILFPSVIYTTTRSKELQNFDESFEGLATKVITTMEGRLAQRFGAVESLRVAVTSYARTANATWPFVTLPDYYLRGASVRELAGVVSASIHPLITSDNRIEWEDYCVEQIKWLRESMKQQDTMARSTNGDNRRKRDLGQFKFWGHAESINSQKSLRAGGDETVVVRNASVTIRGINVSMEILALNATSENGTTIDTSNGPYFPTWQIYPPIPAAININAQTLPSSDGPIQKLLQTGNAVLSKTIFLNSPDSALNGTAAGELYDSFFNFIVQDFEGENKTYAGALSLMYYPIFDRFEPDQKRIVGMFISTIFFEDFFTNVLPPSADRKESVVCVVENACGSVFSYKISGDHAIYLGPEDRHNPEYDRLAQRYVFEWPFTASSTKEIEKIHLNQDFCPYILHVYPHEEFQKQHVTNQPIVYSVACAAVVAFVMVTSLMYDYFVQRRIRRAVKSAQENRAIVSSLFPANVRARLIQEEEDRKRAEESNPRRRESGDGSSRRNSNEGNRRFSNERDKRRSTVDMGLTDFIPFGNAVVGLTSMALAPAKLRLKSFLYEHKNSGMEQEHQYDPEMQSSASYDAVETKPIADLFPHCTVLFADISGFTAWSSEREPTQVFTLLQTIFQKFDQIARKRDVFKVETIGDCYVAVTGLPDPQPDHAIRMTKFARACLFKVANLTKKLEVSLGPGTADLRMRFGLHSGPVTAGVLRGEKSRFQLFGDTVNTASRMESTGLRNRIQVSQSTAQLLIEAGKQNWIQPREDVVHAKGKGPIQTFWVLTRRQNSSVDCVAEARPKFIQSNLHDSTSDLDSVGSGNASVWGDEENLDESGGPFEIPSVMLGGNTDRLIDWQVDLLLRIIKQILAGRDPSAPSLDSPGDVVETHPAVFEEVSECIELPKFDPEKARARTSTIVEVPEAVISELRDYVHLIALRYRDNPFHNFAHASHVSMSANKLLSRIVSPEDVNYHRSSVKAIASDLHQYTYGITSDPLTQFAIMISTLVHDVDHTGVSNQQRGREEPELAERYHDKSVAEQNSIELAWDLFMLPKFSNLQRAIFSTEDDVRRFRQLIVNLVMATDIFDATQKATRNMRWEKVFHSDLKEKVDDAEYRNLKATIVIEHIIQAADVSHTMQHWQVYTKWNERLFNEMYRAFENGRSPNDPSQGWYKGELWFFDNYVIPLAKKLEECGVFGVTSDECLNYALENRREWEVKGEQIVHEMVERVKAQKKTTAALIKKATERPRRRSSFGYYARRSATFLMGLPKQSQGETSKCGESESCGDDDEVSIEMRLNGGSTGDRDPTPHSNNTAPIIDTSHVEWDDDANLSESNGTLDMKTESVTLTHKVAESSFQDWTQDPTAFETAGYECDDEDDEIVFDA